VSRVVITLPAYRAEHTLEKTVADIPPGVADEVILVDDASPDNTVAIAEGLGIRVFVHPQNRGYGGNQKTCYVQALEGGADVIVLLHPDYQYDPKAVPLLIAPILAGQADMTFGSRFAGQGDHTRLEHVAAPCRQCLAGTRSNLDARDRVAKQVGGRSVSRLVEADPVRVVGKEIRVPVGGPVWLGHERREAALEFHGGWARFRPR